MEITNTILDYMKEHQKEAFDLLVELAKIPAPSNQEEKRAVFCKEWLEKQGAKGVYIDEALNVIYPVGCENTEASSAESADETGKPLAVFMAHSDVVFPDTEELPLVIEDGKIKCPGVGDDTANVVALLMTAKYITEKQLRPRGYGVLLVVNSGEEGLGNLKGSRKIMQDFGNRVVEFVTFDGGMKSISNEAVGSNRYLVEIDTEGGHSYSAFGNRNAIAYMASLIDTLYTIKAPENTTYNVGTISGGTSVNTIAQHAQMLYEFRSKDKDNLATMEKHFQAAIEFYRAKGVQVTVSLLGQRPCGNNVDPVKEQILVDRANHALKQFAGKEAPARAASTDCNIPLSMGIPSICVGCLRGAGAHTREEYVEIDSLLPGLGVAFELILYHF